MPVSRGPCGTQPRQLGTKLAWRTGFAKSEVVTTPFFRSGLSALLGSATLLVTLLGAPSTQAKTAIGLDLDYAVPIDSDVNSGGGFAIRVGQQFHPPLIVLVPELVFASHSFSDDGPTVYEGLAGLRFGLGEVIRPGVFAHLGIGRTTGWAKDTGFSYDGGAFLDLTILPLLDLGVHGAYNRMNLGDVRLPNNESVAALQWITLGVHAALIF